MSILTLNDALREAKQASRDSVKDPAGSTPLDEVLISDLYADAFEAGRITTGFITIVTGPGATLDSGCSYGSTCNSNTVCTCASAEHEEDGTLPVRFEL